MYSPKQRNTLWKKSDAILSAMTVFLVGQRITPLLRPWSTTTKRESNPDDRGRSVIRSQEIWRKGKEQEEGIGVVGGVVGCMFTLFCWQVAQPATKVQTKEARPGHQNSAATN